jgi:hypothetical protein
MVGHVYLGWHDLYKIRFNLIVIDAMPRRCYQSGWQLG